MRDIEITCVCGHMNREPAPLSFRAECEQCGAELHACRFCARYAPGRQNDCAEPQAERVVDKEKANRCDWFSAGSAAPADARRDARAQAEALFKKD